MGKLVQPSPRPFLPNQFPRGPEWSGGTIDPIVARAARTLSSHRVRFVFGLYGRSVPARVQHRPTRSCSRRTTFASCKSLLRRSGSALRRLRRCVDLSNRKSVKKFCTVRLYNWAWTKTTLSLNGASRRRCSLSPGCRRRPRAYNRRTQGLVHKEQRPIHPAEPVQLPPSLLLT